MMKTNEEILSNINEDAPGDAIGSVSASPLNTVGIGNPFPGTMDDMTMSEPLPYNPGECDRCEKTAKSKKQKIKKRKIKKEDIEETMKFPKDMFLRSLRELIKDYNIKILNDRGSLHIVDMNGKNVIDIKGPQIDLKSLDELMLGDKKHNDIKTLKQYLHESFIKKNGGWDKIKQGIRKEHENDLVEFCKDYILNYFAHIKKNAPITIYASDLGMEVTQPDNNAGYIWKDEKYSESIFWKWHDKYFEDYEYYLDNLGYNFDSLYEYDYDEEIYVPKDVKTETCRMVIWKVEEIISSCDTIQDNWNDEITLDDDTIRNLEKEVKKYKE